MTPTTTEISIKGIVFAVLGSEEVASFCYTKTQVEVNMLFYKIPQYFAFSFTFASMHVELRLGTNLNQTECYYIT